VRQPGGEQWLRLGAPLGHLLPAEIGGVGEVIHGDSGQDWLAGKASSL
jgi:hypothetical protein